MPMNWTCRASELPEKARTASPHNSLATEEGWLRNHFCIHKLVSMMAKETTETPIQRRAFLRTRALSNPFQAP
jgi:hypothetical protein